MASPPLHNSQLFEAQQEAEISMTSEIYPHAKKYISPEALTPAASPKDYSTVLDLSGVENKITELRKNGFVEVDRSDELPLLFFMFLASIGCVRHTPSGNRIRFENSGHLSSDVPSVFKILIERGAGVFEDWDRRYRPAGTEISAIEFLHLAERHRIEAQRMLGEAPTVFHETPVAFALIKARNYDHRSDVFMFQRNKDWRLLGLIGGKMEDVDQGDFRRTLMREIGEEIGVQSHMIKLTELTHEPLDGYGLSGKSGTLGHYPCKIFHALISGKVPASPDIVWLRESQIRDFRNNFEESPLFVNPLYVDFILNHVNGGLGDLPYSFSESEMRASGSLNTSRLEAVKDFLIRHRWIEIPLVIIGALAALAATLIGIFDDNQP